MTVRSSWPDSVAGDPERAGELLTRRAVVAGDLLELQRLSDAGSEVAGDELDQLVAAPGAAASAG